VQVSRPDLNLKTTDSGFYAISGYPELAFPNLATVSYSVDLTISVPGYSSQSLTVNIPANSTFPVPAAGVQLRRLPVRIQGRVTKSTSDRSPVPTATIVAVDQTTTPPPSVHTCALRTPLYFDHASGVTVRERAFTTIGSAKQIMADARAGVKTIALSNRTGLAAGRILAFGPDIQVEYAVIDSMDPQPSDLTKPGNVTLRNGLNHSFPAGTSAQRVTAGAIGTSRTLAADPNAGDGILLLDGLLNVGTIEVADPTATKVEYHAVGALTDADGFYRLDGVDRVSTISLKAGATGLQDSKVDWGVDYENPVNVVDFRLSP
jgi:hypothetical protein